MKEITAAIERAEGFLVWNMGEDAWETLEDLPSEAKNHPRVLELRLECLVVVREWHKAVFSARGSWQHCQSRLWFDSGWPVASRRLEG